MIVLIVCVAWACIAVEADQEQADAKARAKARAKALGVRYQPPWQKAEPQKGLTKGEKFGLWVILSEIVVGLVAWFAPSVHVRSHWRNPPRR